MRTVRRICSLSRDFPSEPFFPLFPYSNKPRGNTTHSEYVRLSEVEARRRRVNFRFPFSPSSLSCFHSVIALDLLLLLPFSPPSPAKNIFPRLPPSPRERREGERKKDGTNVGHTLMFSAPQTWKGAKKWDFFSLACLLSKLCRWSERSGPGEMSEVDSGLFR